MYLYHLMAALRPSSIEQARLASVPTEPQAIVVYVLLLVCVWAVWQGNRRSGPPPSDADGEARHDDQEERTAAPPSGTLRKNARKKNKAKRRRQGRIDWIQ